MSIGNTLRKLRTKKNYSQQDVADFLEVDRRTYVNWENGENDIKSDFIPKIASFFDVEIKDLFNEETNNESKDNSIVLIVPDKESVDKLIKVLKSNIQK
ncbi:helix-turn-helix transcriptional regulator [Chryseobacterium takakiae]|uniref:DNA-binding transcriptional regulator, XRE-family HTH domain n=1 Tax=Chryseobacterium takakiae TaxID=1302685 RepID=A0A1M4SVH0_9FLAO|nr:helix-turn-helix transcriptional regulator [Chryseobacterium takakiae]SHE36037.1 DNA-binding transcriptional regulator, XRE-family HTH domain [Chryseobacterium takakiae]